MTTQEPKFYKAVPAPELETSGVVDLMRTPADGVDRNSHINWQGARFAVRAIFENNKPHHEIIVDYPSERTETGRATQGIAIDLDGDETPEAVATTSGGHREGMGRLSDEQRQVVSQLIQRLIEAGEDEQRQVVSQLIQRLIEAGKDEY